MMPSGLSGVMMVPSLSSISRHVSCPRIHGGTPAIVEMLLELASTSWLCVGASIQASQTVLVVLTDVLGVPRCTLVDMETTTTQERTMSLTININGENTEVPEGAVAWKYADPTEDACWIYTYAEAEEIQREDGGLIVWVPAPNEGHTRFHPDRPPSADPLTWRRNNRTGWHAIVYFGSYANGRPVRAAI